jgi:type II secretory pathway predicted ATPase ExeA
MYLDYWNLKKFPFENVADPSFFYVSHSHQETLSRLLYASRMRKGAATHQDHARLIGQYFERGDT